MVNNVEGHLKWSCCMSSIYGQFSMTLGCNRAVHSGEDHVGKLLPSKHCERWSSCKTSIAAPQSSFPFRMMFATGNLHRCVQDGHCNQRLAAGLNESESNDNILNRIISQWIWNEQCSTVHCSVTNTVVTSCWSSNTLWCNSNWRRDSTLSSGLTFIFTPDRHGITWHTVAWHSLTAVITMTTNAGSISRYWWVLLIEVLLEF